MSSGHIPDFEDTRESVEADDEERGTDPGLGPGSAPIPPHVEQQLSAAIVLMDLRMRQLEREETKRQIGKVREEVFGLRATIVRVDAEKEANHKRDLETMMAEMRSRTPGTAWKGLVIAMIAIGLMGLGGLGMFVFRGAVALERIQQQQQEQNR